MLAVLLGSIGSTAPEWPFTLVEPSPTANEDSTGTAPYLTSFSLSRRSSSFLTDSPRRSHSASNASTFSSGSPSSKLGSSMTAWNASISLLSAWP